MISAIVLAAGLSTRMENQNKLLLPFKGRPLVVTVVEKIIDSGIEEVIVVTGNNEEQVLDLLKHLPITIVNNEHFRKGMTTSIQKGVSVAKGGGYMICLSDMPFITAAEYFQLKTSFESRYQLNEACICVPEYKNEKGNPVIFSSFYKEQILTATNMEGCRDILLSNPQNIYAVKMETDNILKDIDTPDDYKKAI